MRKVLLAVAALGALSLPAQAAIIADLGLDPTSSTGAFSHSPPGAGAFSDDYTFHLDQLLHFTIASVTNVFPGGTGSSDFITNFEAEVFSGTPGMPGAPVIGPVLATMGCGLIVNCQGMAGSALLASGQYFLVISGVDGGTSGYGGNIATFAVPSPVAGAGIPGALGGIVLAGFAIMRRRRGAGAAA